MSSELNIDVYLTFSGNCEEAMNFYQKVLGGEITYMQRHADAPEGCGFPVPAGWDQKIMHASLQLANMTLMGTDNAPENFEKPQGYHISLSLKDEAEARRVFTELSDGGSIIMPLEKTFWAKLFGLFNDRYGISWMVNYE